MTANSEPIPIPCHRCGCPMAQGQEARPNLCWDCLDSITPDPEPEAEPETEQDRIDAAGDDLFHSMREDGEL